MIVFDKKYLLLEVDSQNNCLIQHWKGFATSEQFQDGILRALEIFREHHLANMISDTKDQSLVKKEDTDFAANLLPEFIKSGMQSFAFVVPSSMFTQLALNKFKKETTPFNIQYFDDLNNAKNWLKSL